MKYSRKITDLLPKTMVIDRKKLNIKPVLKKKIGRHVQKEHFTIYMLNFVLSILIIQALISIIAIFALNNILVKAYFENREKQSKAYYWERVAEQYPYAPDVLFNTAKSVYEIGEKKKALNYIEKSLQIDPLFEKAQKLKQAIQKG